MRVAGLFRRLPGFPEGVDVVVDLGFFQRETGIGEVDFFLARTTHPTPAAHRDAVAALRRGPGAGERLNIDTTETTFDKDQSSLTALNVRGLLDLDSLFTLAIAAAGGLLAGLIGGGGLGVLLVRALEPLFILAPVPALPVARLGFLVGLLAVATVASALAALQLLRRLSPSEVLRER